MLTTSIHFSLNMQQKSQLINENPSVSLATNFASLIDINPTPPLSNADEVKINGDAHASYAIFLIPLLQQGYISLAKNKTRNERLTYLQRLDEISASTNIDQLEIAGENLESLRRQYNLNNEETWLLKEKRTIPEVKIAEDNLKALKSLVQSELNDFSHILSLITLECGCKVLDLADSTGDRGYCDILMLETFFMFERIGIPYTSMFSNHTLETLYALLTNKWAINTRPAFIKEDFSSQIRSLKNFRVLLHYGLVSPNRKNELLSSWVQHINLLAYSYPDKNTAQTNIYSHAPTDITKIINLAINYCRHPKDYPLIVELLKEPKDSLKYHKLLRKLINEICSHFRQTFFTIKSANALEKLVQYNYQKIIPNIPDVIAMYTLCLFTMQSESINPDDIPSSMTFYHGHRTHKQMYGAIDAAPKNLVCLDNDYFKPSDPCSSTYYFSEVKFIENTKFLNMQLQEMQKNTLYYSLIGNFWTYKGKSDAAVIDAVVDEEYYTVESYFSSCIEADTPCCFLFLNQPAQPDTPTFRAKHPFYSEYKSPNKQVYVPYVTKGANEYFANFFTPNRVNISIFTSQVSSFNSIYYGSL